MEKYLLQSNLQGYFVVLFVRPDYHWKKMLLIFFPEKKLLMQATAHAFVVSRNLPLVLMNCVVILFLHNKL
ncbi:hypothetical protein AO411_2026800 [Salmonella enterica subsp. enterica serovar Sarajane]|nr:hypothetical protein AO411_2026800 [Salmonella enterica subsp. enterica serovar Sarajane]